MTESPSRASEPIRLIQVGAGDMGRAWLRTIAASPDVRLVAVVDLDVDRARVQADEAGFPGIVVAADLPAAFDLVEADAVVDVTVPRAHLSVNLTALDAGLDVLCEKPLSESLAECLIMAAAAEHTGRLLMVSQSRRYFRQLDAVREQLEVFGRPFLVTCHFSKAVSFGGFRATMPFPLLVDMAIHPFDLARDLIGSDPVAVVADAYDPPWSPFAGSATSVATFRFAGGARFSYTGSWCSPGLETSWNGVWRLACEGGTIIWDGDHAPVAQTADGVESTLTPSSAPEEIAGSLAEFVAAVRDGRTPAGEVHDNLVSVAMVRAAVESASTQAWVDLGAVLDAAYVEALVRSDRPELTTRLRTWGSPRGLPRA